MDVSEFIFGKLYKLALRGHGRKASTSQAALEGLTRTLAVAFEALSGIEVQVEASREFVGFYKGHLFLPRQIDLFGDKSMNERLYWLLMGVHASAVSDASTWHPRKIVRDVCEQFPGLLPCANGLQQLEDRPSRVRFDQNLFFGNPPVFDARSGRKISGGRVEESDEEVSGRRVHKSAIKKDGPNVAELKEFDPSSENPIVHFFEKVRTAEAYTGGNKRREAEDSVEDMEDALKEVDLRTVIRSNERTPGLIKTNSIVESNEEEADADSDDLERPSLFYPEWHHHKRQYRNNWCSVYVKCPPVDASPVVRTDSGQVIKSRFQSLFNHFLWQGGQRDGPDLDLEAVVENQVSKRVGGVIDDRLFVRRIDQVKDLQVLVMMDESLSTESYLGCDMILSMMKRSLGDLLQGFEHAPDQIALMSFFSETRKHCTINVLKDFGESIGTGQTRLEKCRPQGYTRIGVSLRHANFVMGKSSAKKRCIILMTDSKPSDFDRYEGRYGIADVKKASEEVISDGHEVIVLSYSEARNEAFQRMFSGRAKVYSATTQREMNQRLLEIIERLVVA